MKEIIPDKKVRVISAVTPVIISKKYQIWPKNEEILQTTLFSENKQHCFLVCMKITQRVKEVTKKSVLGML